MKKQWLDAAGVFVRDMINSNGKTIVQEEESVEDMDMPF